MHSCAPGATSGRLVVAVHPPNNRSWCYAPFHCWFLPVIAADTLHADGLRAWRALDGLLGACPIEPCRCLNHRWPVKPTVACFPASHIRTGQPAMDSSMRPQAEALLSRILATPALDPSVARIHGAVQQHGREHVLQDLMRNMRGSPTAGRAPQSIPAVGQPRPAPTTAPTFSSTTPHVVYRDMERALQRQGQLDAASRAFPDGEQVCEAELCPLAAEFVGPAPSTTAPPLMRGRLRAHSLSGVS
jgi:hypothetical protein